MARISIADAEVREPVLPSLTAMSFLVTLDAAATEPLTVAYRTEEGGGPHPALGFREVLLIDGTWIRNDSGSARQYDAFYADFVHASGTLTFAPGETSQTIEVMVRSGPFLPDDPYETFLVVLDQPIGGSILDGEAIGTIIDSTVPLDGLPTISLTDAEGFEPVGSAPLAMGFLISLSHASADPVTVSYATSDGSAVAGDDFVATTGMLTFAPGQTIRSIDVDMLGDARTEQVERFTLTLYDPINGLLGRDVATGHILEMPRAPQPPEGDYFSVTRAGMPSYPSAETYSGPVGHLDYAWLGTDLPEVVAGTLRDDFMSLLGADDAANGLDGDDVLDGGAGSNFLSGGAGHDVFFLDGRGGELTWSTIADWTSGEQVSLWGWRPGTSRIVWRDADGVVGYQGVTLHADLDADGRIDVSVTWAGVTREDRPVAQESQGLLWFA
ncbi:Calx-beta domain-containing protein [Falsiroseomonas sp. HC035]|uniref:Calx-beta domain-containing protein n=1 Tax=Falsiroseomonas sp. HC035 TaxID=3390999 RepID=UPI003D3195D2